MALERSEEGGGRLVKPQFFENHSGHVGWTDGQHYTAAGIAPDQAVRVTYLVDGCLHQTFEFIDAIDPAPLEKVARLRHELETRFADEKKRLEVEHAAKMTALLDDQQEWAAKFSAVGAFCCFPPCMLVYSDSKMVGHCQGYCVY